MPSPRFQAGNDLAKKTRAVEYQLRNILRRPDYSAKLRTACMRLIDSAAEGETWQERIAAFNVIADRLDGKVVPMLDVPEDRAFSVTWSFGPAALEVQSNQQLTSAPALPVGEVAAPVEREG